MKLRRLATADAGFDPELQRLTAFESAQDPDVDRVVADIVADVRLRGDAALLDYTRRFDRLAVEHAAELELPRPVLEQALAGLPAEQAGALRAAAERIRAFHRHQKAESWTYTEADGTVLGQRVTPLDRVGLYVPGWRS